MFSLVFKSQGCSQPQSLQRRHRDLQGGPWTFPGAPGSSGSARPQGPASTPKPSSDRQPRPLLLLENSSGSREGDFLERRGERL